MNETRTPASRVGRPAGLRDTFARFGGTDSATGGRMKMKVKNGRALVVGALIGAVVASAAGVAYAAIPDGGGIVHACFQNVTSANKPVKLLDTAKATTCPSGWKQVTWNQKGQPGAPGAPGTPGAPGVSGYQVITAAVHGAGGSGISAEADCPAGKVPLGGGWTASAPTTYVTLQDAPVYVRDGSNAVVGGGWTAELYQTNGGNVFGSVFVLTVYVNCATAN
jgi:hypothetical protein